MPILDGRHGDAYDTFTRNSLEYGAIMETPDGARFRFTEMGGTVGVANKLYQAEAPTTNWLTQAIATAMAVGDKTILFTPGATTINAGDLAGGTALVEETADLGHIYPIKSNPTISGSAEGVLTLADGVTVQAAVAVAGGNVVTCLKNRWKDVIISPASANTGANAGVPRVIIALDTWGWLQTRGVASCLIDSGAPAALVGNNLRASEDDVGAVALTEESAGILDYQIVGYALETAPDGDFGHIFLTIE